LGIVRMNSASSSSLYQEVDAYISMSSSSEVSLTEPAYELPSYSESENALSDPSSVSEDASEVVSDETSDEAVVSDSSESSTTSMSLCVSTLPFSRG